MGWHLQTWYTGRGLSTGNFCLHDCCPVVMNSKYYRFWKLILSAVLQESNRDKDEICQRKLLNLEKQKDKGKLVCLPFSDKHRQLKRKIMATSSLVQLEARVLFLLVKNQPVADIWSRKVNCIIVVLSNRKERSSGEVGETNWGDAEGIRDEDRGEACRAGGKGLQPMFSSFLPVFTVLLLPRCSLFAGDDSVFVADLVRLVSLCVRQF